MKLMLQKFVLNGREKVGQASTFHLIGVVPKVNSLDEIQQLNNAVVPSQIKMDRVVGLFEPTTTSAFFACEFFYFL
jgi:hypothetical protein